MIQKSLSSPTHQHSPFADSVPTSQVSNDSILLATCCSGLRQADAQLLTTHSTWAQTLRLFHTFDRAGAALLCDAPVTLSAVGVF